MINDPNHQFPLDSYAQSSSVAGIWMELVDRHLPDPLAPHGGRYDTGEKLAHFSEFEDSWPSPDFLQNPNSERNRERVPEFDSQDEDSCDCGGPPPPFFNVPPPPPPPSLDEGEGSDKEGHFPSDKYVGTFYKSDNAKDSPDYGGNVLPSTRTFSLRTKGGCENSPTLPQDACPAFLVAGDAHVRPPRLHPPMAALLVGATTFALVIGIAAAVCWRLRRHRTQVNSSKPTSDMSNGGVIYEDLPSGPTPIPRMLTSTGHDPRTLAPMELLDLKMATKLHNSSYGTHSDHLSRNIINPFSPGVGDATKVTLSDNLYSQFTYQYRHDIEPKIDPKEFCYDTRRTNFSDFKFKPSSQENILKNFPYSQSSHDCSINTGNNRKTVSSPRHLDNIVYNNSRQHNPYDRKFEEILKSEYSEPRIRNATNYSDSQELYNPTYEEISTGSYSTSVTSGSSDDDGTLPPSPQTTLVSPSECFSPEENGWSEAVQSQRGKARKKASSKPGGGAPKREDRQQETPLSSTTSITEISDYPDGRISNPQLLPHSAIYINNAPPIPPPALYTIPGTSDGRTSTSSSSDLPPDRCTTRETRYYVVPQSRSPSTPSVEGQPYTSSYATSQSYQKERLPPLPSRSDRYRIFFTTDRRRGALPQAMPGDSKTLDISSRRKNREKELRTHPVEIEPLYHEM